MIDCQNKRLLDRIAHQSSSCHINEISFCDFLKAWFCYLLLEKDIGFWTNVVLRWWQVTLLCRTVSWTSIMKQQLELIFSASSDRFSQRLDNHHTRQISYVHSGQLCLRMLPSKQSPRFVECSNVFLIIFSFFSRNTLCLFSSVFLSSSVCHVIPLSPIHDPQITHRIS